SERQARLLAEALYASAAALNSSLEIEEVFDLVIANVGRVAPNEFAMVMILEGEQARFVHNPLEKTLKHVTAKVEPIQWRDYEVLRLMADSRQPLLISDLRSSDSLVSIPAMSWMNSYLGAPLRIKNKIIGFIHLGSQVPEFFKPQHAQQLDIFALQASLAIENAQLFMETRKRAIFLGLLNEITRLAISAVDEDATLTAVAEKMSYLFCADGVFVTVWDEEQQLAIPATSYGYTNETFTSIPYQSGELTLTASVLRSGHALAVDDIHHTIYFDKDLVSTFPLTSMLGLPLIADGIRLGAVIIGFKDPHHFTQEEIENGEQVSGQVALAVSKARLYSQVQRMAVTDELTGLYNRRGIFDKGRVLFAETQKRNLSMGLIWMDIDHFKTVN
ncbi:MAG: GAF domain-containing protein, partial [Saprospiraceae bacterium]|nr:GAF domain-containing protein [Saprospiraceae bacterium]